MEERVMRMMVVVMTTTMMMMMMVCLRKADVCWTRLTLMGMPMMM